MKPLLGPRFRAIVLVLLLVLLLIGVVYIAGLQSRENGEITELDITTGRLRTQRRLFGRLLSERIEETWISRTVVHNATLSGRWKTVRLEPLLPELALGRMYINFIWGGMASDLRLMNQLDALEVWTSEAKVRAATTTIELWHADDEPYRAQRYVNDVAMLALKFENEAKPIRGVDLPDPPLP